MEYVSDLIMYNIYLYPFNSIPYIAGNGFYSRILNEKKAILYHSYFAVYYFIGTFIT